MVPARREKEESEGGGHGARVETARWEKPAKGQGSLVGERERDRNREERKIQKDKKEGEEHDDEKGEEEEEQQEQKFRRRRRRKNISVFLVRRSSRLPFSTPGQVAAFVPVASPTFARFFFLYLRRGESA